MFRADHKHLQLVGKASRTNHSYHPAAYHMLDVAHVAQQLLSNQASPRWRTVLAEAFNVPVDTLIEWLPWLVALHDVGKLSVPFQASNEIHRARLEQEGLDFGSYSGEHKLHHTLVGRLVLEGWAKEKFGNNRAWQQVFLDMVAGHHGTFQQPDTEVRQKWRSLQENAAWESLRLEAIGFLRDRLLIREPIKWPRPANISTAIVALTGFVILADWLGSDEAYFASQPAMPPAEYVAYSKAQAQARVADAGLLAPVLSPVATDFTTLFGWEPRPLQTAVMEIPKATLTHPTLTIIESLTGEGKTEAAMMLAHRIGRLRQTNELYVALPTTATSNAMFQRLKNYLQNSLQLKSKVKLLHGQAFLVEDDLCVAPPENDGAEPLPIPDWFAPKKRALLAPFGVGTIDQAELAALNVRHNALRLIGLAGKVVILDEVHAYDTYMTTIIAAMLKWLAALGSSVILLSATLPLTRREQLIEAYTGRPSKEPPSKAYPYLLTVNRAGNRHEDTPPPAQAGRQIELNTLHFAEEAMAKKASWLLSQVAKGGTVCWICNLVDSAQALFRALQKEASHDVDILLLHGRFPLSRRQEIEAQILDRYGKAENGRRPAKGIVVGTQVLEQSLDLDFDLMISDLAPIDLLLQRVGRLHRHLGRANRSLRHPKPRFFINTVLDKSGRLKIGGERFYTEYILLKSWEAVQQQMATSGRLNLPQDYRPLVEHVYDETAPSVDSPFRFAWEARQALEIKYQDEAKIRLAGEPHPKRPFWQNAKLQFAEDEDGAAWLNAQTRFIGRETITVVPLVWLETGQLQPVASTLKINPHAACSRQQQLELLQFSLRLSKPNIVAYLKNQEALPLFIESHLLQRCFPLLLKVDTVRGGWIAEDPDLEIRFHRDVGLEYA